MNDERRPDGGARNNNFRPRQDIPIAGGTPLQLLELFDTAHVELDDQDLEAFLDGAAAKVAHEAAALWRWPVWTVSEVRETSELSAERWVDPPGPAAFSGFAGEVVKAIEPFTEGDPVALLAQFLVAFGNAVGRRPHTMAGAERHGVNLNVVVVGRSAKARKGASLAPTLRLFQFAAPEWSETRVKSGLSSGEGLVHQVRDAIGEDDAGEPDKRLFVVEAEFARVLRVMSREGNLLSTTIRDAWDGRPLGSLTKSAPTRATAHHISVVAHITAEELRRELTATDAANGFANRFLFLAARRSQLLPSPPRFDGQPEIARIASSLGERVEWASGVDWIYRTPEAEDLWDALYRGELAREWRGLFGALTARGEAQMLRLSALYALVSGSKTIGPDHIRAALELWRYSTRSVGYVFGNALGDPIADRIRNALREAPDGTLSRSEISGLFSRHGETSRLQRALELLEELGIARCWNEPTAGRPVERWSSCEN